MDARSVDRTGRRYYRCSAYMESLAYTRPLYGHGSHACALVGADFIILRKTALKRSQVEAGTEENGLLATNFRLTEEPGSQG